MTLKQSAATSILFFLRHVVFAQGIYYLATGLWPILSMASFQVVTGPKTDLWIVKTVALLLIVIGSALLAAAYQSKGGIPITILGLGTSLALVVIELVHIADGIISPIYLIDTLIELFFAVGWIQRYVTDHFRKIDGTNM